jgi:hypothetical protein
MASFLLHLISSSNSCSNILGENKRGFEQGSKTDLKSLNLFETRFSTNNPIFLLQWVLG